MKRTREAAFIGITCLAQFMSLAAMNQSVAPVLVLAEFFEVEDYGTLSWFSASFSMSVGTFILPAGRLGDMYGHKKVYLIGWLWFAAFSVVTGFSYVSNNIFFSICRAFQGIGPALLVPNAVALIGRTLPVGKKRMIGFAFFGACGPLGATVGAVFSALIAELAWWPWSFWALSIACIIAMALSYIVLPPDDILADEEKKAQRPKFDYWGTITGVSGLVLVNFALNQAPLVTWANPYAGALLGGGIVCLIVFILVELYATDYPLIPIRGLGIEATFALTCIVAGWASHGVWVYNLYLFLEHLRGHSALLTSAETSPVAVTGVIFAFSTVWLIQRVGIGQVMFFSMTCFMGASLLIVTMPLHQIYWAQTFASLLIAPGAMNLSYPAANMLLSSTLPRKQQGIAASLVSTMVNYSISCGLGVAGTIDSPEVTNLRLSGMRAAYWFATALGGLGMVVALVFIAVEQRRKRVVR
ncbi:MFS general substrate transporter [Periconia macrospinosa]|uniref:MFS general substrate transporter n=1 Tax=Periconia macrospinosa TaxID=97972 RepID=A0A2V1E291_9PLEO|nr:MFS general substrate transporter [Periconia macrospinosa]